MMVISLCKGDYLIMIQFML